MSASEALPRPVGRITVEGASLRILQALILVGCACAFIGLGVSSYWIDELFTEFLLKEPDLWAVFQASLKDVHPPVYYLAAKAWQVIAGPGETSLRAFSAVCAVGAIATLYLGLRGVASPFARAFVCAVAVGSKFWFFQAQNARMYALGLWLGALFLTGAVQAVRRARADQDPRPWLVLAGVTGLLASLTHHYLFAGVGLGTVYLLFAMKRFGDRALVVVNGAVTLAIQAGLLLLLAQSADRDGAKWIENTPHYFVMQSLVFVYEALDPLQFLFLTALALIVLWRGLVQRAPTPLGPSPAIMGLGAVMFVGVFLLGVASSLVAPSFSARNLALQSPAFWLLIALTLDDLLRTAAPRFKQLLMIGACLVTLEPALALAPVRLKPIKEEWRSSARHIADLPACRKAVLTGDYVSLKGPSAFAYGYYLPEPMRSNVRLVDLSADHGPQPPAWAKAAMAQAARPGGCPIVLWAVHGSSEASITSLAANWSRDPALPADHTLVVRRFPNYKLQRALTQLLGKPREVEANAFTVEVWPKSPS